MLSKRVNKSLVSGGVGLDFKLSVQPEHRLLTTGIHCLRAQACRTSVFSDHREVLDALQIPTHAPEPVQGATVRSRPAMCSVSALGRASPLGGGTDEK